MVKGGAFGHLLGILFIVADPLFVRLAESAAKLNGGVIGSMGCLGLVKNEESRKLDTVREHQNPSQY